jgi:hypothetical protein
MESKPLAVVWTAPGTLPPGDLLNALDRGGLLVRVVDSPYLALAYACRIEQDRGAGIAGAPGAHLAAGALVVVEPANLEGAGEVCESAERYAPAVRAWMYIAGHGSEPGEGGNQEPRLRAIGHADIERWLGDSRLGRSAEVKIASGVRQTPPGGMKIPSAPGAPLGSVSPRQQPVGRPKLRLTEASTVQVSGAGADLEASAAAAEAPDNRDRSVLTSEELDMLLNDVEPGS